MYDLVVLGGGAGGLNVASAAARVGAKVALIEKGKLGGECTHTACVPSKTLLKAARIAHDARRAFTFGVSVKDVHIDFQAVMNRVRAAVASFYAADTQERLQSKGIDVLFGSPAFEAYDTVVVDGRERVSGSKFVIATGSRPEIPEVPGLIGSGFLDNTTVWDLDELPESLLILGAGPVGLEFGQAFARLGSKVTILDHSPTVLGREEPEAAQCLRGSLADEGIAFLVGVEPTGVDRQGGRFVVKYRAKDGSSPEVSASHLLVATGRRANVEGLNLPAAGLHGDPLRGIPVDEYLQTGTRNIYAIGDVNGLDPWTHAAERQASVVFQNAVLKLSKKYDRSAVPRTIFTDPEFAAVGLTEAQALRLDPEARSFSLDVADVDRIRIDGDPGGLAKVVVSPSGKVLGASIVGPEASLVLQQFTLAIDHGISLGDLAQVIQPYPTAAGLVRSLANKFQATRLEKGFVKTALKWFYGFEPAGARG